MNQYESTKLIKIALNGWQRVRSCTTYNTEIEYWIWISKWFGNKRYNIDLVKYICENPKIKRTKLPL